MNINALNTFVLPAFKAAVMIAVVLMLPITPANNAHARQQILSGEIEAQHVCHDGANRGAAIQLYLTERKEPLNAYYRFLQHFYVTVPKGYYTGTTCADLSEFSLEPGTIVHAWYSFIENPTRCKDFSIKYVENGSTVWVQNGGHTIFDVTCVAKDGL